MDVVTAFLNSQLKEEVFIKPPEGFPERGGKVLRLLRALYSLKQSPHAWYTRFLQEMKRQGWRLSDYNSCVFINDALKVILAIWVDDLLLFGAISSDVYKVKEMLKDSFKMTNEGEYTYYLGMYVRPSESEITLSQEAYIQQILVRFSLQDIAPSHTPADPLIKQQSEKGEVADPDFRHTYQAMTGSLMYLSTQTRPDITHTVGMAYRFNSNPNQAHLDAVIKIYSYLKGTPSRGLSYAKGGKPKLIGYIDSDHGGYIDTARSITRWVFLLAGSPIS